MYMYILLHLIILSHTNDTQLKFPQKIFYAPCLVTNTLYPNLQKAIEKQEQMRSVLRDETFTESQITKNSE